MTNIELIKELLKSVEDYGVLPVYLNIDSLKEYEDEVKDIRYCTGYVTLYNH